MSDGVEFQTAVTATPPNATVIATDNLSGTHHQIVKVAFGDNGTAYGVSAGTPMPVILYGTVAGSVFGLGTYQVLGTVQLHGTNQAVGTFQPLAGSVHIAAAIPAGDNNIGNVDVVSMPTVTITATNLDIRDLTSASDSVAAVQSGVWSVGVTGTVPLGTVAGTVSILGTAQLTGTAHVGTVQRLAGGTINSFGGTLGGGTVQLHGTGQFLGTTQALIPGGTMVSVGSAAHGAAADLRPLLMAAFGSSGTQAAVDDGDSVRLWADLNGRLQIRGTIDSMPAISVATGTIPGGTIQAFGTTEVLGTVRALTTVDVTIGTIAEGTINSFGGTIGGGTVWLFGTTQGLGTYQPLAGSVHVANSLTIGAALPAGNNNIGDVDIASMPTVTVQATNLDIRDLSSASDSVTVVGTVQTHGTSQVLGTVQTVAGMFFGSVQGWQAHDGAAAGNPLLMGALGSSGTQAAVADGDAVRLWADLNGRLQVRGTIDSIPSITIGVALPAGDNNIGNVDVVTMPTVTVQATNLDIRDLSSASDSVSVVGTVQTHGTSQVLGTTQPLAGSVHVANVALIQGSVAHDSPAGGNPVLNGGYATRARPGTVAVDDVARFWTDQHGRQVVQVGAGTSEPHGTTFVGAGANGTILAARGAGSFWRIFDMTLSGSGGGTFAILQDTTVIWGPLFIANNGGWSFNSAVGVRLPTANSSLNARFTAGTWSLFMNYGVEGA